MASCSGCMRAHCNGRRGPELPQRPGALGPLTILSAPNTNSHGECWDMVLMDGEMLMQDLKSDEYRGCPTIRRPHYKNLRCFGQENL